MSAVAVGFAKHGFAGAHRITSTVRAAFEVRWIHAHFVCALIPAASRFEYDACGVSAPQVAPREPGLALHNRLFAANWAGHLRGFHWHLRWLGMWRVGCSMDAGIGYPVRLRLRTGSDFHFVHHDLHLAPY